jgi:hypothetical protein
MAYVTDILKAAYLIITMLVAALVIIHGWATPNPTGFFTVVVGAWVLILNGSISIILAAYGLGKWP